MKRPRRILREALLRVGVEVRRVNHPGLAAADHARIIQRVRPFTMTPPNRVGALVDAVHYLERYRIEGSFVECGVWRGGSMMAAALSLLKLNNIGRNLHLLDTYDGMSEPTEEDVDRDGLPAVQRYLELNPRGAGSDWCIAGLDDVRSNLYSTGYPIERLSFVKGKVEQTIPGHETGPIALLRLDTDWYESTRHTLKYLTPRMVDGAVLIIDDYGHWQGARKAVDEWLTTWRHPILLQRIDQSARMGVIHRS